MIQQNEYLLWAYESFGFADTNAFLIALGLAALVATCLIKMVGAFYEMAFGASGMELAWDGAGENTKGHDVEADQSVAEVYPSCYRPTEVGLVAGDAKKARKQLGWTPQ